VHVDLFDFDLPQTCIAQHPAQPRDSARMLVIGGQNEPLEDHGVTDLAAFLKPGDLVVFNDTKVIPARLSGRRIQDGVTATVELTLHKRDAPDTWCAFARPAKKLKMSQRIDFDHGLKAEVLDKRDGGEVVLRFNRSADALMATLEKIGWMPLPPYIKRAKGGDAHDLDDYQTLFAAHPGAVAAPTAGLHFTPRMIEALTARGVHAVRVTLHVGAGTFLPVKVADTRDHKMHSEWGEISPAAAAAINHARANGGRVVAIGTTSLRVLESAADGAGFVHPFRAETDIFITPGYRFKVVDALMTNFHLPKSTLFMLVSAFGGLERLRAAYAHAIETGYRFYSYGDACLLTRTQAPATPATGEPGT